jgi:hypothetical protein
LPNKALTIRLAAGLENRECRLKDPSSRPRDTLYPQKLALTSLTSGDLSVCIVRSPTKATELLLLSDLLWGIAFFFFFLFRWMGDPQSVQEAFWPIDIPCFVLQKGMSRKVFWPDFKFVVFLPQKSTGKYIERLRL